MDISIWEKAGAALVLVLGAISKVVFDYRKAKAEERLAQERVQLLRDIAMSNQAIREGQIQQNGKLAAVVSVNAANHLELIRAVTASCKARPILPMVGEEQREREKHEKDQDPNRNRPPWHKPDSVHRSGGSNQPRREQ